MLNIESLQWSHHTYTITTETTILGIRIRIMYCFGGLYIDHLHEGLSSTAVSTATRQHIIRYLLEERC